MTTPAWLHIWQLLDEAWEAHDPAPTVRELVTACGLSSTSVALYAIKKLEREQIIQRDPGKARSIRLLRRFEG